MAGATPEQGPARPRPPGRPRCLTATRRTNGSRFDSPPGHREVDIREVDIREVDIRAFGLHKPSFWPPVNRDAGPLNRTIAGAGAPASRERVAGGDADRASTGWQDDPAAEPVRRHSPLRLARTPGRPGRGHRRTARLPRGVLSPDHLRRGAARAGASAVRQRASGHRTAAPEASTFSPGRRTCCSPRASPRRWPAGSPSFACCRCRGARPRNARTFRCLGNKPGSEPPPEPRAAFGELRGTFLRGGYPELAAEPDRDHPLWFSS